MRAPCPGCGSPAGHIQPRNGQDCVFCAGCGQFCYNAPRAETGREIRSLRSRPDIKPSKRARILERDGYRCFMCGRQPGSREGLVIGHLLSVADGRQLGIADDELNSEENLAAQCEECNSGLGERTVPLWLMVAVLRTRLNSKEVTDAGALP
jgi:5-methylcytosine-specific restriction endonuclease McrA